MPSPTDSRMELDWWMRARSFSFGADLVGDVDAEAEDVGLLAGLGIGELDELVAEGDDADVAVLVADMEAALGFSGLGDFAQVTRHGAAMFGGHERSEGLACHLVDGTAEAFGAVGVDAENGALEVVGADHAERTFDELAVAGFAFGEGGFGLALDGDVDAGGDDEVDLALSVDEGGGGPGDAVEGAVFIAPVVFEGGGELAGTEAFEGCDGFGDLGGGDEFLPDVAADECGEVVAGDLPRRRG